MFLGQQMKSDADCGVYLKQALMLPPDPSPGFVILTFSKEF